MQDDISKLVDYRIDQAKGIISEVEKQEVLGRFEEMKEFIAKLEELLKTEKE